MNNLNHQLVAPDGPCADAQPGVIATRAKTPSRRSRRKNGTKTAPADDGAKKAIHRTRQGAIAGFLDMAFGEMSEKNTQTWPNRAYLRLVATIHDLFADPTEDLSMEDIIDLAKALAENRRSLARDGGESWERVGLAPSVKSAGAGAFADSVREIYGLSRPPLSQHTHTPGYTASDSNGAGK